MDKTTFIDSDTQKQINAPLNGTLIHGTHRMCDLIPAMLEAIRDTAEYAQLSSRLPSVVTDPGASEWDDRWQDDDVAYLYEELTDIMERYAPDGYYFGPRYLADGSDFGYWRDEQYMLGVITDSIKEGQTLVLDEDPVLTHRPSYPGEPTIINGHQLVRRKEGVEVGNKSHMVNINDLDEDSVQKLFEAVKEAKAKNMTAKETIKGFLPNSGIDFVINSGKPYEIRMQDAVAQVSDIYVRNSEVYLNGSLTKVDGNTQPLNYLEDLPVSAQNQLVQHVKDTLARINSQHENTKKQTTAEKMMSKLYLLLPDDGDSLKIYRKPDKNVFDPALFKETGTITCENEHFLLNTDDGNTLDVSKLSPGSPMEDFIYRQVLREEILRKMTVGERHDNMKSLGCRYSDDRSFLLNRDGFLVVSGSYDSGVQDSYGDTNRYIHDWLTCPVDILENASKEVSNRVVQQRYDAFKTKHGEEPLYAEVNIHFRNEKFAEPALIKLNSDIDPRDDKYVFFNATDFDNLKRLIEPDNGEDFYIVDIQDLTFQPKSLYLNDEKAMTVEQIQEKAINLFGNNFEFDYWKEKESGTKIDRIDLGDMPDTISIDKLEIKDGQLSLYSNDIASDVDLQALDDIGLSKIDVSLDEIKGYLDSQKQSQHADIQDVILRADELGIDFHPVGLKGDISVDPHDLDMDERGSLVTFQYATVKDTYIVLHRTLYDVFDSDKEIDIEELPQDLQQEVVDRLHDSFFAMNDQMVVVYDKQEVPTYALGSIINGELYGIQDPVDEKNIRDFMDKTAGSIYEIEPDSESFRHNPAFGLPTECETVFMVKAVTPSELLGQKKVGNQERKSVEEESLALESIKSQILNKKSDFIRQMKAGSLDKSPQVDANQDKFLNYVIHGDRRYQIYQNLETRLNAFMKAFKVDIPLSNTLYGTGAKSNRWSDIYQTASRAIESILRASGNGDEKLMNSSTTDYVSDKAKNLAKSMMRAIYSDEESYELRREEALKAIGYPYKHGLETDGSFNIPTVDKSLYWDYAAGLITVKDAAREFCRCGWTNFVDEKYTLKKFGEINKELGKLDANLKPLVNQPKAESKKIYSELREARGYLKDVISHTLSEMNGHIEIAHTELSSVTPKGDWKNEGNGHVFMELIKGDNNDAMFHDVHAEKYALDKVIAKLDLSEVNALTQAVHEARMAHLFERYQAADIGNGTQFWPDRGTIGTYQAYAFKDNRILVFKDAGSEGVCLSTLPYKEQERIMNAIGTLLDRHLASTAAKQVIHDRIVTPTARSFTPDQVEALNRYHQVATPDKPVGEVFRELLKEVSQEPDVARKPEKWVIDTAKELDGLAEGITREESRGLHK